jgi:hypothetical protein
LAHKDFLDLVVGVWSTPGGGAALAQVFLGQGWSTLEEQLELITIKEVVLITSACHQTHNTIFDINLECRVDLICTELNMNTPFKDHIITMSPVLSVWPQHVRLS